MHSVFDIISSSRSPSAGVSFAAGSLGLNLDTYWTMSYR